MCSYNNILGYCTLSFSSTGLSEMIIEGNRSGVEGSQVFFYCNDSENQPAMEAICMKTGDWSPDPHTYKFMCHYNRNDTEVVASTLQLKFDWT